MFIFKKKPKAFCCDCVSRSDKKHTIRSRQDVYICVNPINIVVENDYVNGDTQYVYGCRRWNSDGKCKLFELKENGEGNG